MINDYIKTLALALNAKKSSQTPNMNIHSRRVSARDFRSVWLDFGRCTEKTELIKQLIDDTEFPRVIGLTKIRLLNNNLLHFSNLPKLYHYLGRGKLEEEVKLVLIDEPFMFKNTELETIYDMFSDDTIFVHLGRSR